MSACVTETTTQSFRAVKNPNVESSYIATDADFSKYDRLLGKEMGIYYPSGVDMSEAELQKIRQIFRTTFLAELKDYSVVSEPGPGVLAVQATVIDMRSGTYTDVPNLRNELRGLGQPGEIVFLMELQDSESGYVLGRAADGAQAPAIATGDGRQTDWASVETAVQNWATLFRKFLDDNLKQQ
jgi:hypothetical protein